jgi:hypothetical protein
MPKDTGGHCPGGVRTTAGRVGSLTPRQIFDFSLDAAPVLDAPAQRNKSSALSDDEECL